ncbi:ABC transporter ATP-binding protein [Candidatus Chloroploca asiatica]|uniref:Spermidine/putrescine import ATP-binding protein PotA n=1 Tax=Candidatus Chloroploca asiatica TaxID=1506545 RepID=A0A2H3KVW3_9CHLR|nr:ABC transporter ATP-binding protein [Candidatus Chloroploca asiatica]PDV98041.1 spermidine/putrescine ABC transporter ATP-binding protein [Candidatus Chloroploca asiatica]
MTHLELSHIRKAFGPAVVVEDFNLAVTQGEFISFLGPSGCGKTTTLRMIAGFELPTAGTITIDSTDLTNTPPNKRNVGMVFQSYALFPNMTVAHNVGYGLKITSKSKTEMMQRVHEMLALIQMEEFAQRYPFQLSGGQQQRVALARALAIRPKLLLLDEPLSALDAKIRLELRHEIRRIQRQLGLTTIYVTHDQEEALSLSDRIVVMSKGKIEQVGTPTEIYNAPATEFVARFVGHINLLPVTVLNPANGVVSLGRQTLRAGRFGQLNGRPVQLAVRPEEINLGAKPDANTLNGEVESVTYLGSIVRIGLRIEHHPLSLDVFNEHTLKLPRISETLAIHFPVDACWLMEKSD